MSAKRSRLSSRNARRASEGVRLVSEADRPPRLPTQRQPVGAAHHDDRQVRRAHAYRMTLGIPGRRPNLRAEFSPKLLQTTVIAGRRPAVECGRAGRSSSVGAPSRVAWNWLSHAFGGGRNDVTAGSFVRFSSDLYGIHRILSGCSRRYRPFRAARARFLGKRSVARSLDLRTARPAARPTARFPSIRHRMWARSSA